MLEWELLWQKVMVASQVLQAKPSPDHKGSIRAFLMTSITAILL